MNSNFQPTALTGHTFQCGRFLLGFQFNQRCGVQVKLFLVVLLAILMAFPPADICSQDQSGNKQTGNKPNSSNQLRSLQDSVSKVIEEADQSVVSIVRVDKGTLEDPTSPDFVPKEFGTGVAISEDGLILTCYHVLGDISKNDYYVWQNGLAYRVRKAEPVKSVLAADPWTDLAVLKIDAKLRPIKLATDYVAKRGQFVISLGNPYGIAKDGQASASFGIVSNLKRQRSLKSTSELNNDSSDAFSQYGTLIQTDARLHRETSGGPLMNLKGEMIGLGTALTAANHYDSSAGFAIPVDQTFLGTVAKLRMGRSAEFGFLGIATKELSQSQRAQFKKGVVVTQVVENTPADICGLKFGDVITHVNDLEIGSSNEMLRELSGRFVNNEISIKVQRKPFPNSPFTKVVLKVKLGKKKVKGRQPTIGVNDFSFWRGMKVDFPTAIDDLSVNSSKIDPAGCIAIIDVKKDSLAASAGLNKLDFISHVNGKRVGSPAEFFAIVESAKGAIELTKVVGKGKAGQKVVVQAN